MEIYFNWISEEETTEIEVGVEPTVNSYEEMVTAILTGKPDPRFDNE